MERIIEKQLSLFDYIDRFEEVTSDKNISCESVDLSNNIISKFENYNLETYINDVETIGLENTWNYICQFVLKQSDNLPEFIHIDNFSKLYEIGLAIEDKFKKKKCGQYATPDDVALVMAKWLERCSGDIVCDVACGTGKLILTFLELIGYEKARELICGGKLYLYDSDDVALRICRTAIAVKYGLDVVNCIHSVFADFLDKSIHLPDNCKVICNPPYAKIEQIQDCWENSNVLLETKELYSAFMEKIFTRAKAAVIITPFSFISGTKYHALREIMCDNGSGFIVSFDNIPGNIFNGKKQGVFNSNTSNSVRAAITVMQQDENKKGYKVSPLIRFKNEERERLLLAKTLEETLPQDYQIITKNDTSFKKIDKSLEIVFQSWIENSKYKVKDMICENKSDFLINVPNTCRYYTTASSKKLNRVGAININIRDEEMFQFLYCFVNSSFAYWWWRVFDGGITYSKNLFINMPVPFNLLTDEDKRFFASMSKKMIEHEDSFIITKKNAGSIQQNIKFPEIYRLEINSRILKILGIDLEGNVFDTIHANYFFDTKEKK